MNTKLLILITSVLTIFTSCNNQNQKNNQDSSSTEGIVDYSDESVSNPMSSFEGSWSKTMSENDFDMLFNLDITIDQNNLISAIFNNGGPFEENYTCELTENNELVLFYESKGGSISFNESLDQNTEKQCIKTKCAICKIISENEIEISTFNNKCSELPKNSKIFLTK